MVIDMAVPTKEEYEAAMQNVVFLQDAIVRETRRKENFINELCASQKALQIYKDSLNKHKEIVDKYQIYQGLLEEGHD